jgi:3-oxoacyl-[acyl-carrier protein] reductase
VVCVSTIGTVLNFPGGTCYFASKAAVEQFCRVLAKEVAPRGLTVSVVSPGFTQTKMLDGLFLKLDPGAPQGLLEMTPLRRFGQPEEIAEVTAFLVSGRGRWVTRKNIAADGGIISR